MTTQYEDIGSDGNGFPSNNEVSLNFKTSVPEGFDLRTKISRAFAENKETIGVEFKPSFTYKNYTLSSTILTKPEKEISFEVEDLFGVEGSSLEIGTSEDSKAYSGSFGFANNQLSLSVNAEVPHNLADPENEITFGGSGVFNYPKDQILWGVEATFTKSLKQGSAIETGLNGRIHFQNNNTTLLFDNLLGASQTNPLTLSLLWDQKVSDSLRVATKYSTSTDIATPPTLEAVIERKGEDGSVCKSKASLAKKEKSDVSDLKFQFSYTNKFSSRATYTLGADVNAREFFGGNRDSISLGFEVKLV